MTGPLGPERPTTEAGRYFAAFLEANGWRGGIERILAIEAEARADSQREAARERDEAHALGFRDGVQWARTHPAPAEDGHQ